MNSSYKLPLQFMWHEMTINETTINEIYDFLSANYVEDESGMFVFNYSKETLLWALQAPEYKESWHVVIKVKQEYTKNKLKTDKIVGFVSGIPITVFVNNESIKTAEINFLCVHKKLRGKNMATVLIKELKRRIMN